VTRDDGTPGQLPSIQAEDVEAWLNAAGSAEAGLDIDALWRDRIAPVVAPPRPSLIRRVGQRPRAASWRAASMAASVAAAVVVVAVVSLSGSAEAGLHRAVQDLTREADAALADRSLTAQETAALEERVEAVVVAFDAEVADETLLDDEELRATLSTLTRVRDRMLDPAVDTSADGVETDIAPVREQIAAVTERVQRAVDGTTDEVDSLRPADTSDRPSDEPERTSVRPAADDGDRVKDDEPSSTDRPVEGDDATSERPLETDNETDVAPPEPTPDATTTDDSAVRPEAKDEPLSDEEPTRLDEAEPVRRTTDRLR
jgi:hypothetical protein